MGIFAAILLSELSLRFLGFQFTLHPTGVRFGWPDDTELQRRYEVDKDLLWVPKHYNTKIERWRGQQPSIVFMGDSCTEWGVYDQPLGDIIARNEPNHSFTSVNVGVAGWSSYQGLQQLKRDVIPMRPKVIAVYYGWNDHWKSNDHWTTYGIEDKAIGKFKRENRLLATLDESRLVQVLTWLTVQLREATGTIHRPMRVSPDDFRNNLTEIVRVARSQDITPILMTAPSSHVKGNEPPHLTEIWLDDLSELVPLHHRYADIVRSVAKDTDTLLLDLIKEFKRFPIDDLRDKYFRWDGIHLTPEGNEQIAAMLYRFILENDLLNLIVTD